MILNSSRTYRSNNLLCNKLIGYDKMKDAFFEEKLNKLKQINGKDVELLMESAEADSDELANWQVLTNEFFNLGMLSEVLVIIDHVIGLGYDDEDIWITKGIIYDLMENHQETINCFKKVLEINPDDAELWAMIANSYLQLDDIPKALESIGEGIKINSEIPKLWATKGNILLSLDSEFDEALECYNVALKLDPNDDDIWYDLSNAYSLNNQYSNALDAIDQAISINPDCSDNWFSKGIIFHYMERFKEAIEYINMGLEMGTPDFDTWGALAYSYYNLKDYENALDAINHALELEPDNSDLLMLRGMVSIELNMSKRTSKCEDKLFESDSKNYDEQIPYKGTTLDDFK